MRMYASTSPDESPREAEHRALAREAAREGMVLLTNDGTLPLATGTVALFGMGARRTVAGGTGSGDVQPRSSVSIEQGLRDAGVEVVSGAWLDDYDRERDDSYAAWKAEVNGRIVGIGDPHRALFAALGEHYAYPTGRALTADDLAAAPADVALYVLARQAGEGNDRRDESGDYRLTDDEIGNLKLLAEHYDRLVLVINVGGTIDLSPLDDVRIGATVFIAQPGMAGGAALADLLTGAHDFTGRLAQTWPLSYAAVPHGDRFGTELTERYHEGLYVGYRHADTFGVRPRWAFGHGLSYAAWEQSVRDVRLDESTVTATVAVHHAGDLASRQVVQAYLAPVGGRLPKPAQALVAFAKSDAVAAGSHATVELSFDLADAASWDPESASWVLDADAYVLRIGAASDHTEPAAVLTLPGEIVTGRAANRLAPTEEFEQLVAPGEPAAELPQGVPHLAVAAAAVEAAPPAGVVDEDFGPEVTALLDRLTLNQQADLLRGADLFRQIPEGHQLVGSGGMTSNRLLAEGVPNVSVLDGPAGLNVNPTHLRLTEGGELKPAAIPEKYNWEPFVRAVGPHMVAKTGEDHWRWATAWPVAMLLAQTWDVALLERVGHAVGVEMLEFGVTGWLAPGLNLYRNPLCGRNFEYFSEDPLVSGAMAAALTRGVQSHDGLSVTIKHFACNNREDNRMESDSVVPERALRELYLKAFEIAVKRGHPRAVMSSYNKLNGTYTSNNRELLTDVLRGEWGFQGLVMSDWGANDEGKADPARCAKAGNDLVVPGQERDGELIAAAIKDGRLAADDVRRSAGRVLRFALEGARNLG